VSFNKLFCLVSLNLSNFQKLVSWKQQIPFEDDKDDFYRLRSSVLRASVIMKLRLNRSHYPVAYSGAKKGQGILLLVGWYEFSENLLDNHQGITMEQLQFFGGDGPQTDRGGVVGMNYRFLILASSEK
jgi:hypothetical protein